MTADIEMLPLPGHLKFMPSQQGIESYARAVAEHNVSRAQAPVGGLGLRDALLRAKDKLSDGEWEGLCRMFQEQDSIIRRAVAEHNIAVKDAEIEAERAERLAEEIDWIKSQPEDDRMFAEIEAAAKASFHRHRASCRGQVLTRADSYESHLVWSALEWAKRTNGAEQHAEQLAEALRGMMDEYEALHAEYDLGDCQATVDARAALRAHDQEGK